MSSPILFKNVFEKFSFITIERPELKLEHDNRLKNIKEEMKKEITDDVLKQIELGLDEVNSIEDAIKVAYTKKEAELHQLIAKMLKERLLLSDEEQEKLLLDRIIQKTKSLCYQDIKFLSLLFIIRYLERNYRNGSEYMDLVSDNIANLSIEKVQFLEIERFIDIPKGIATVDTYKDVTESLFKRCKITDESKIQILRNEIESHPNFKMIQEAWKKYNLGQLTLTSIGRVIGKISIGKIN